MLVFAHVLVPHPPFLFKPDGSYRQSRLPCLFFEGSYWRALADGSGKSYVDGYRDAIKYLDTAVTQAVDGILKSSRRPPIILVQGDHGTRPPSSTRRARQAATYPTDVRKHAQFPR